MKHHNTRVAFLVLFVIVTLSSCSVVFRASIGGVLKDQASEEGIEGMDVFIYTDASSRDADYQLWSADTSKVGQSSKYRGKTQSDAEGNFTIDRIIWESNQPAYGKTADYIEVFFIFFHEDYGVHKNSNTKHYMIASDSANNGLVSENFTKVNKTAGLTVSVVNQRTRAIMTETVQAIVAGPLKTVEILVNGGTLNTQVSYPLSSSTSEASITLTRAGWLHVDSAGTEIQEITVDLADSPIQVQTYMQEAEPDFPTLSGRLAEDATPANNTGKTILLGYDDNGSLQRFPQASARITTQAVEVGDTTQEGVIGGLGQGLTYEEVHTKIVNASTGEWSEVYLILDVNNNGTIDSGTDKKCQVTVQMGADTYNVGLLTASQWTAIL
ncbi:hypothetical protein [Sphaerochaeta halotolerans]|uniref:hypothetical protein n=1 Tax=Sphaerochaeta halotolerans TaxID=2293840 RepID=UPI00136C7B98|nr:hypothetical protein [Sphaerochaeta halotolerans]MDK2860745.1 hypothetical protein [Sphaerochaeta sp.]MXI86118.1 hypothetical protein [Sphaerochaeta halotolerans]